MTLPEKIKTLYPGVTDADFIDGVILLQNDSAGAGDYIRAWNHPTFAEPSQAELDALP